MKSQALNLKEMLDRLNQLVHGKLERQHTQLSKDRNVYSNRIGHSQWANLIPQLQTQEDKQEKDSIGLSGRSASF